MTDADRLARNRYLLIALVHIAAVAGALFGLVLAARAQNWAQTVLGGAIILSGLYMMAVVPRALAHRWRSPDQ